MPAWFIAWAEVIRTRVTEHDGRSELGIDLVGGDTVVVTVETDPTTLESALAGARGVRSS